MELNSSLKRKHNFYHCEMEAAKEDVLKNNISVYKASKKYNIPKSTLLNHLNGKNVRNGQAGRPTVFTSEEEQRIADTVDFAAKTGLGLSIHGLRKLVQGFVKELKRDIPIWTDGTPGIEWTRNFKRRNNISYRAANNLQKCRKKSISPIVLSILF